MAANKKIIHLGGQTSPRVSALAASVLAMSDLRLDAWLARSVGAVRRDIRTLCGSLVEQAADRGPRSRRLARSVLEPYSQKHDGSEVGDFQTYVRKRTW